MTVSPDEQCPVFPKLQAQSTIHLIFLIHSIVSDYVTSETIDILNEDTCTHSITHRTSLLYIVLSHIRIIIS